MEKETAIRILNEVLSELGITSYELSKILGMKRPQGLYDVLNPDKKVGISMNLADKIVSNYPKFSKSWLLTGEGSMLNTETQKSEANVNNNSLVEFLKEKITELEKRNSRLENENGYYRGLLDKNGIDYSKAVS